MADVTEPVADTVGTAHRAAAFQFAMRKARWIDFRPQLFVTPGREPWWKRTETLTMVCRVMCGYP